MPAPKKPILRSLGEFFGHIVHGIKTDPAAAEGKSQVVGRKVEQRTIDDPAGQGRRVTLRRTTIDEIEVDPSPAAAPPPNPDTTEPPPR